MRLNRINLGAGLLALSVSAFAGECGNDCAWGLANSRQVMTECKVNAVREDGKTSCFSSDKAMDAFMKDAPGNLTQAQASFGRV
jgi:hypothetical protein